MIDASERSLALNSWRDFSVCLQRVPIFAAENRDLAQAAYPTFTREAVENHTLSKSLKSLALPRGIEPLFQP